MGKKDIENAIIVGKSKKIVQTSDGKKFHLNNSLNDLNGAEWSYFLRSVFQQDTAQRARNLTHTI